jgi:hypothetical protein
MQSPADDSIASRLAARRESGVSAVLWPDVSREDWQAAHRRIVEATGAVLNRSAPCSKLKASDDVAVTAAGIAAFVSGMGPLLGYWIEDGVIEADQGLSALLAKHLEHGRGRAKMLHEQLVRILHALNERGVAPTILKGTFTSRHYFPEVGTRPTADIDLLVSPGQLSSGQDALKELGLVELRRGQTQSEWGLPGTSHAVQSLEFEHRSNPWVVDLHNSVDKQYFRGLRAGFGDLPCKDTHPWEVDGHRARLLAQPLFVAHLALHASVRIRQVRLVHLVELVFVIRNDTAAGILSWDALAGLLADTGTARFVYPALELAERLGPGTIDADFRREIAEASTARMRRVVDGVHTFPVDGFFRRSLDEKLMWAAGPLQLTASLVDLIWPTPEAVADRWRMYRWHMRRFLSS